MSRTLFIIALLALGAAGSWLWARSVAPNWTGPDYGPAFGQHWYDGNAELAGYTLTYPRYGQLRRGTAVAIFVSESQQESTRIKPERPVTDSFGVVKLNLMLDFPTGLYDYHLMTSAFVATQPRHGRPAGAPTKLSFSAQEWCGHAYHQTLFDKDQARYTSHSYFEGEADQDLKLQYPAGGFAEDALLLWARGLAGPRLEAGGSIDVPLLRESAYARLRHVPLAWDAAHLARSKTTETVDVPVGAFVVDVYTATVRSAPTQRTYPVGGRAVPEQTRTWTFYVEAAPPHRVVKWQRSDGIKAELLGAKRLPYWSLNANGREALLKEIGLQPRPARTP